MEHKRKLAKLEIFIMYEINVPYLTISKALSAIKREGTSNVFQMFQESL